MKCENGFCVAVEAENAFIGKLINFLSNLRLSRSLATAIHVINGIYFRMSLKFSVQNEGTIGRICFQELQHIRFRASDHQINKN